MFDTLKMMNMNLRRMKVPVVAVVVLLLVGVYFYYFSGTLEPVEPSRQALITKGYSELLATYPPVSAKREQEVRQIIRANTGWTLTHSGMISPSRAAVPDGVQNAYTQLSDSDIPVLIEIIRKHDLRYSAEHETAKWVLQLFGSRALNMIVRVEPLFPRTDFVGDDLSDIRIKIKEDL